MSGKKFRKQSVVCFGDSITQGVGLCASQKWPACLQRKLQQAKPGMYKVYNRGIGGNTTAMALDRIDRDVLGLLPGMVLVEFGINDAYVFPWSRISRLSIKEYERNLGEIIRIIRRHGGRVILIRNHANTCNHAQGNGRDFADNFAPFDKVLVAMAARRRIPVIDLPALMKSSGFDVSDMVTDDGLHLSSIGNRHYAELVFIGMRRYLDE